MNTCGTCKHATLRKIGAGTSALPLVCKAMGGDDGYHAGDEYEPADDTLAQIEYSEWGRLAVSQSFGCVLHAAVLPPEKA